jgi:multiple sugar transport system substrate-binding protein
LSPWRVLVVLLVCVPAAGCGGGGGHSAARSGAAAKGSPIDVWIAETEPDRVAAARRDFAGFTRRTGIEVGLKAVGDDQLADRVTRAARDGTLPDVIQLPMASAHEYARQRIIDADAAQDVVRDLGEDTFSARALSLLTAEGRVTAVPSDGWGQLLIYRKDLFDKAGLPAPRSLEDIRRAAARLTRGKVAGIALSTGRDTFTAQSFEHIALAAGCRLVDDGGHPSLDTPACRRAFAFYTDLARRYSPGGKQDVDTTRQTYFAGRAAMILWSPFLLDAMAGLVDDARPTCPECRRDPAYLARHSGLVGPLEGSNGSRVQFGEISTWGIVAGGDVDGASRFVEYMLSDGYLPWLAISPQGKYPLRFGPPDDPNRYVERWARLPSGVDRKAPLSRFYSEASIASLGDGVRSLQRWGFEQGRAALVGPLRQDEPVAGALAAEIRDGSPPEQAAREAQAAVQRLSRANE